MGTYSSVVFTNGSSRIHSVKCDNPCVDFVSCPYLKYLSKNDYHEIDKMNMGGALYIDLEFWCNYSSKEKNLRYPKSFCESCQWNRGR